MLENDIILSPSRSWRSCRGNRTRSLLDLLLGPEVAEDRRRRRPAVLNVMTATIFLRRRRSIGRWRRGRRLRRLLLLRRRRSRRRRGRGGLFRNVFCDAGAAKVFVVLAEAVPVREIDGVKRRKLLSTEWIRFYENAVWRKWGFNLVLLKLVATRSNGQCVYLKLWRSEFETHWSCKFWVCE